MLGLKVITRMRKRELKKLSLFLFFCVDFFGGYGIIVTVKEINKDKNERIKTNAIFQFWHDGRREVSTFD